MRWAILGGAGQLAKSLSEVLEIEGYPYRAWGKEELDVTNPQSLIAISQFAPTVIVNCAAWTDVEGAEMHYEKALKVNRDGAKNIAIIARILDIPLIHVSTDYVFAGDSDIPWKVNDEKLPRSNYGKSKLLGEQAVSEIWSNKSFILRTAWLYGPNGGNFAKKIVSKALKSNETVKVVNDQFGQPTSVIDLAQRILLVANSKIPYGVYHATNSGRASWFEFARELFSLSGRSTERVSAISSQEFPSKANRPSYSTLDHSMWEENGLPPMRAWREALRELFPAIRASVEEDKLNG